MKKLQRIGLAALLAMTTQPSFAAHHGQNSNIHGPIELGNFVVQCCGNASAVAQFAHQPDKGTGVQLQVTQPSPCAGAFAAAGLENISGRVLNKELYFGFSGLNGGPLATSNFSVNVIWTPPHGTSTSGVFTVANGGLTSSPQGGELHLIAGTHPGQIAPGSTLSEVNFVLEGNNVTSTQTAFLLAMKLDLIPVYLDHRTATASCTGGN